ncbi:hypothetical protein [Aureibacillus halotolerans]|uniref:Uncharacterized protein n=1 Tax=Aureibacillus halotolerans TaxID=1508390 RepID=A0A4R6TYB0_9BACI|nr:hypothetical protein [Aureibacillus halotolerans]TDQ38306.1 hypothetical protein EV213_11046 [Aureibacillus halotolerans]
MVLFALIAILLVVFFSSSMIEKRVRRIEELNAQAVELLKEIKDKDLK